MVKTRVAWVAAAVLVCVGVVDAAEINFKVTTDKTLYEPGETVYWTMYAWSDGGDNNNGVAMIDGWLAESRGESLQPAEQGPDLFGLHQLAGSAYTAQNAWYLLDVNHQWLHWMYRTPFYAVDYYDNSTDPPTPVLEIDPVTGQPVIAFWAPEQDLIAWQKNYDPDGKYAATNTPEMGDWNGDNYIDGGDLAIWQWHLDADNDDSTLWVQVRQNPSGKGSAIGNDGTELVFAQGSYVPTLIGYHTLSMSSSRANFWNNTDGPDPDQALAFDMGTNQVATFNVIPEPATLCLVAAGVGALAAARRRRRTQNRSGGRP